MPDKKKAPPVKAAAKTAAKPAVAKKAPAAAPPPAARREPVAAKKAPAPVAAPKPAAAPKAAAAPKVAAKAKVAPPAAKPAVVAPKAATKPAPTAKTAAKAPAKPAPAPKAEAKGKPEVKAKAPAPAPKAAAKVATKSEVKATAKPEAKGKAAPAPKPAPAAKAPKPEKPAKPAPPPKAEKPAPAPKPPAAPKGRKAKLPPVPMVMPTKPNHSGPPRAVAAGKIAPMLRPVTVARPVSVAPKPLSAPKPSTPAPEIVGDSQPVPAFKAGSGASPKSLVLVGAIAGAFGVKGEVRLRAFTTQKDGVISYGPLYGEDGKILMRPKSWRELKDGVAVIAPEVKTREQAEAMRGTRLFVPRANLPKPAEDEFYVVDLLGSRAEALDGQVLGEIIAVWNFGAGDILEYRPPNGGPNVRITFTKETVPHVDLPGKRVVLDPPAPEPEGK